MAGGVFLHVGLFATLLPLAKIVHDCGNQGVQIHFKCGDRLSALPTGDTATVRLTYSNEGNGDGATREGEAS